VTFAPSQEVAPQFPEISAHEFQRSVWLVFPDRRRVSGAGAAFELMAQAPGKAWTLWLFRKVPGVAPVSEAAYRGIADHRDLFYWITRILWGKEIYPAGYRLTRSAILKGIGLVFLIAFLSMLPQISGLIGSDGISPVRDYLSEIHAQTGIERYWLLPTLLWVNSSDVFLHLLCWIGIVLSAAIVLGLAPLYALAGSFLLYLSIVSAGQDFLAFQWDILLLEAGFAAMAIAPRSFLPRHAKSMGSAGIWLMRFLIFRLMLESGLVKRFSGDTAWHDLTALKFHFETQPLPTPLGWYAHQLPEWFQSFSTAGVFVVELAVPFLFFMPRRLRIIGAWITIVFQLCIAATGNYTFFNLLTIVLCLSLFDDRHIANFLPRRFKRASSERPSGGIAVLFALILAGLGFLQLVVMLGLPIVPAPFSYALEEAESLHIVSGYGLFAVMTTTRPEIVIEGSNDGTNWLPYEFRYKPGDVKSSLHWVAPYQPRLDWQMWFAALSEFRNQRWFTHFMEQLLKGSPEVLGLLGTNPFPDKPPANIRASLYDYRFTTSTERRESGNWWVRTYLRPYFPAVRLK